MAKRVITGPIQIRGGSGKNETIRKGATVRQPRGNKVNGGEIFGKWMGASRRKNAPKF